VPGSASSYQITGLSALNQADGSYVLSLDASGVSDTVGAGEGIATISWLVDTMPPDSNVAPLPAVETSSTFPVTAVGDDPGPSPSGQGSGLVACDLYVSTNGGPFVYWTTVHPWAPTALFQGQQDTSYSFYSIGHDALGNSETKTTAEAQTFVPDLTAPVTHVTSVDSSTPTFHVSYAGSDTGGSGLASTTIFVQVDGDTAQPVAAVTAPSGTVDYAALVDGTAHSYRFYSLGTDGAGNVQAAPTDPTADVVLSATFAAPDRTPPVTHVTAVDSSTSTFVVSYSGSDTGGSGLAHTTIFVQVDGAAAQQVATVTAPAGTVNYAALVDGSWHTYRFYSVGTDDAGNVQAAPTDPTADVVVTTTLYPPDVTPPVTHVTAVDSTTPTFVVSYAGTDTGGSGLAHTMIFVQVDGGAAQQVAQVDSGSGTVTYNTLVDGNSHTYRFYSQGVDGAGNVQPVPTSPTADVVATAEFSAPDHTPPVTHVTAVDSSTPTFVVSYAGTDAGGSGLASTTIFVQVDGGAAQAVASGTAASGTVTYTALRDGNSHTYRFYSVGTDGAGNVQAVPTDLNADVVVTTTFAAPVVDQTPPVTHVTAVDSRAPTFVVSYAGSDRGSGLDHILIFVQVDGGPAEQIALVTDASGTVDYTAPVDGNSHTYRFYSQGIDHANNLQPAPTDPTADVVVTTTFTPPDQTAPVTHVTARFSPASASTDASSPVPLQSTGLVIQHGAAERSYIRYLDFVFNESDGLDALIAGNHVHLIKHSLNGTGATPIALDGLLHVVDHAIEIDFGALGLGGNPNSSTGDGYYEVDIDGVSQPYFFTRLLGDANGDGTVNQADVRLVQGSVGRTGTGLQGDVNGDGAVTKTDLALTRHALGHKLALGQTPKHGGKPRGK
jgi:hypothetical protein